MAAMLSILYHKPIALFKDPSAYGACVTESATNESQQTLQPSPYLPNWEVVGWDWGRAININIELPTIVLRSFSTSITKVALNELKWFAMAKCCLGQLWPVMAPIRLY